MHISNKENSTFIRGRDAFERMNYLYQLSSFWVAADTELAAYYAKLMTSISTKSVLRLDRSIKRSVCKGCGSLQIEGETSCTKFKKNHRGQILKTCLRCGVQKCFPICEETSVKRLAEVVQHLYLFLKLNLMGDLLVFSVIL